MTTITSHYFETFGTIAPVTNHEALNIIDIQNLGKIEKKII
jgi:hypothetical protein